MKSPFKNTHIYCLLLVILSFCTESVVSGQIVINEMMSKNEATIADFEGDYPDWIEIYNGGESAIDLSGYGLSDNTEKPLKWTFPSVEIESKGVLLIFASGKDTIVVDEIHTNFSIKSSGESLILSKPDLTTVDYVGAFAQLADQSYGRFPDGDPNFATFVETTPNVSNNNGITIENDKKIYINEFLANNVASVEDGEGMHYDWIELYNASAISQNLAGYSIKDGDTDGSNVWTFPDVVLESGKFLLIYASGLDTFKNGDLHTNFSIDSGGENLLLYDTDKLIDYVNSQQLVTDESYGRSYDAAPNWRSFTAPTPNETNLNGVHKRKLDYSRDAGQHPSAFELELTFEDLDTSDLVIYYSRDGSEPTPENGILYDGPIIIDSRAGEPNYFSSSDNFQTTNYNVIPKYEPEEVFKINVIRARAFQGDRPASKVYTKSYLIHPDFERYSIPMISIVSDPDNLFSDERGIYVVGSAFNGIKENTMNCFQKGSEWERPTHFEFFMDDEILSLDGGLRINGGGSRRQRQKSFRLYGRSEYDKENEFKYQFFEEKDLKSFKRLVLRGQDQEANGTFCTDEIMSNLAQETNIARMATRPAVVFLNGEFWGIYHIRERVDKYYLRDNYDADPDNLDILNNHPTDGGCCNEGTAEDYLEMIDFMYENPNSNDPVALEYVKKEMDIDQYLSYLVFELWAANHDWPTNNVRFWRERNDTSKWRWIMYDLDFGIRSEDITRESISNFFTYPDSVTNVNENSTFLGRWLINNDSIRSVFANRFEEYMMGLLGAERVACEVITYSDQMLPMMEEYIDRYGCLVDFEHWEENIEEMYNKFASFRQCQIQNQLFNTLQTLIEIDSCKTFVPDETPCIQDAFVGVLNGEPLIGNYSIGSNDTTDFTTIEGAIDTMIKWGINGSVSFNLLENDLDESINLDFSDSLEHSFSCDKPIYFRSATEEKVFVNEIRLNSLSGFIFDGLYVRDSVIIENSSCISFESCVLNCPSLFVESEEIQVTNNTIYKTLQTRVSDKVLIHSNIFLNTNFIAGTCSDTLSENNAEFKVDFVNNLLQAENEINAAVEVCFADSLHNFLTLDRNVIEGNYTFGLKYTNLEGAGESILYLYNNFISSKLCGIHLLSDVAEKVEVLIFNNNVNVVSELEPSTQYAAFTINKVSSKLFKVKNNIFSSAAGGKLLIIDENPDNPFLEFDYNNYYTSALDIIGTNQNVFRTVDEWTAFSQKDSNSVSLNPRFESSYDLHINNPYLFSVGDPEQAGAKDIDGDVRTLPVSIGADEINATLDAGVTRMTSPAFPVTIGQHVLSLELTNFGSEEIDSITVGVALNGELLYKNPSFNVNLMVNDNIDLGLTHITFSECETYYLKVWTEQPNFEQDNFPLNDTLKLAIQPCVETCAASISDVSLQSQTIKACSNGMIDIIVENAIQDTTEGPKTTFALVRNGQIIDHNAEGVFLEKEVDKNYCVLGIRYLESDGLSFGNTYINDIQNDFGFRVAEGACISVSECVPVEVEILFEPAIVDYNIICQDIDFFDVAILLDSIDSETILSGSALAFAESYEIIDNSVNLYNMPTDEIESYFDFNVSSGTETNCGGDNIQIPVPDCRVKNDIELIYLLSPEGGVQPGILTVKVVARNLGENSLFSAKLNCTVNDTMIPIYTYINDLGLEQYDKDTITIGTYNFEELECYNLTVWSENPNGLPDENIYNDTIRADMCIAAVGIDDLALNLLEIKTLSPNPAIDYLNVTFMNNNEQNSPIQIEVFDVSGRKLQSEEILSATGENIHRMNVENLPSGLYLLQINDGIYNQVERFVKR